MGPAMLPWPRWRPPAARPYSSRLKRMGCQAGFGRSGICNRSTPRDLAEIVDSGTVLPAGITRFRVRERVLGVRYPLDRMMEGDPRARNAELREFVEGRWKENRVRYYGEPVVLFE